MNKETKIALGIAGTAIVVGGGIWLYRRRRSQNFSVKLNADTRVAPEFTLVKGAQDPPVRQLQEGIIFMFGNTSFPNGATGVFDDNTVAALKLQAYPETVDGATWLRLTERLYDHCRQVAEHIILALHKKDFTALVAAAKMLGSEVQYGWVEELYRTHPGNSSHDMLNDMLSVFTNGEQQQTLKNILLSRITNDLLQGIDSLILTRDATTVWTPDNTAIAVDGGILLGAEVATRDGYTAFVNNGNYFLVRSNMIQYL